MYHRPKYSILKKDCAILFLNQCFPFQCCPIIENLFFWHIISLYQSFRWSFFMLFELHNLVSTAMIRNYYISSIKQSELFWRSLLSTCSCRREIKINKKINHFIRDKITQFKMHCIYSK